MQHLWRKRYVLVGWITVSAVSLVLLIAAIHTKNNKVCKGINVEINGAGNNFFVDAKQVTKILTSTESIKEEPIENINLRMLEERLKTDNWIADADLFFDNNEVLQAVVVEKDPVARIFTVDGSSFYIDSACEHLPLSDKLSARVPMFTNFPTDRTRLSRPDSELMASVKELALFIQGDDFWKAQVSQIDITPDGFEVVPTIGNHIVLFGDGEDYKEKFDRLFSFYKQVSTQVGFDKYEKIDVRFKGQVIATKKGTSATAVDTSKAKEVLVDLLTQSKKATEAPEDDTAKVSPAKPASVQPITRPVKSVPDVANRQSKPVAKQQPKKDQKQLTDNKKIVTKAAIKPAAVKKITNKKTEKPAEVRVPKAVMKKKVDG
jgi:cell division protein FtsQ